MGAVAAFSRGSKSFFRWVTMSESGIGVDFARARRLEEGSRSFFREFRISRGFLLSPRQQRSFSVAQIVLKSGITAPAFVDGGRVKYPAFCRATQSRAAICVM